MMLTIVIATMGSGIERLEEVLSFRHPAVRYLIVQQIEDEEAVPQYLQSRADVEVVQSRSLGLSRSRNIGLQHCRSPYALIGDDDVTFLPQGIVEMLDIIDRDRPDFALFKIKTNEGEPAYKSYPTEKYRIDSLRHWVSSIEILVRVDLVKEQGILFDERFGLGSKLGRGEEEVFVQDLIRNGWRGAYYPVFVVRHPYESSGKRKRSREEQEFFQGAFDARVANGGNGYPNSRNSTDYQEGRAYIAGSTRL